MKQQVIRIDKISTKEVTTKEGKTINLLLFVSDCIEYSMFDDNNEEIKALKEGDYVRIFYQINKGDKGVYYNLLTITKLDESEGKEMAKQQNTTKEDTQVFVVKGQLYWSHVKSPNTKTRGEYPPSNKYEVNLVIDDKKAQILKDAGITVKMKKGTPGQFVHPTNSKQPTVIGTDGQIMDGTDIPLLGNGTEAMVTIRKYKANGKNCLGLNKIELLKIVPYESAQVTHLLDD